MYGYYYNEGFSIEAHNRISAKSDDELRAIRERFHTLTERTKDDYDDYNLALIYLRSPWLRGKKA